MLRIIHVSSAADPRLSDYLNVPDAELIARRGVFVAEGRLVVRRLLASERVRTRSVMVTAAAVAALADALDGRPEIPVYVVPQALMDAIAGFNIHRGCLAIGEPPAPADWRDVVRGARTIVVL